MFRPHSTNALLELSQTHFVFFHEQGHSVAIYTHKLVCHVAWLTILTLHVKIIHRYKGSRFIRSGQTCHSIAKLEFELNLELRLRFFFGCQTSYIKLGQERGFFFFFFHEGLTIISNTNSTHGQEIRLIRPKAVIEFSWIQLANFLAS